MITTLFFSCGIWRSYFGEDMYVYYDQDLQKQYWDSLLSISSNKYKDSISNLIKPEVKNLPDDLRALPLIIETYSFNQYLNLNETLLSKKNDSKKSWREFTRFDKRTRKMFQNSGLNVKVFSYAEYSDLDPTKYKYVVRQIALIEDLDNIKVYSNGSTSGFLVGWYTYIYDRSSNKILGSVHPKMMEFTN